MEGFLIYLLAIVHHHVSLIHGLMCKQVFSQKKYEMWSIFGGQPFRFSLMEFGAVIGLCCDEFPEGYKPKVKQKWILVAALSSYLYNIFNVGMLYVLFCIGYLAVFK